MPELPEVETVRRTLVQLVKGKTIEEVEVRWPKMIKEPDDVQQFELLLRGQTILDIGRRGKFLLFTLSDFVMVSHLRMEGRYGLFAKEEPMNKHVHVIFRFTDGTELRYQDVRKFGTYHLFKPGEELKTKPLVNLGPEPFDESFTVDVLKQKLQRTNRNIKAALLDQSVVVGLGNIYVDEALFRSNIHPETIASSLTDEQMRTLHREIILTLQDAVEKGGSTVRSYVNSQGEIGLFQLDIFVYGRNDEPCKKCGTVIEKSVVAGRGTHICPNCQRK
ncbi:MULTISPECIES: DNA-formamidopyrimidine glycosylase [Sutcliffiella]|uniref:DNA-formamidopyrimidine glycosylase n=1 Tax=Sutcliffiella TaxID=2837511 RepID=UPI0022DD30CE|nr:MULTISPECIES: DNA-formamidopyrimidine glycosylase [Sutcliffiella]MED4016229.1 DNA-formamidopyrimidine glycosylase [Sutcliffiella cohnii]WBL14078.1 DNA-formamidopyrimidine glycosylase [Sutcliffiella sp. NC1]